MADVKTVFICSTFTDLSHERQVILEAIRRLELRHDSMEFFGARANRPLETCLAEVRKSDILVVVVSHLYGSIADEVGVSYSEAEYSEGHRLGKICLVYMRDDNVPVLPKDMERDPRKMQLLADWKARLQARHTVAPYKDREDLVVQVAVDLTRSLRDLENAEDSERWLTADLGGSALIQNVNNLIQKALDSGFDSTTVLSAVSRSVNSLIKRRTRRPPSVFLSYSHEDFVAVRMVASRLQAAGLDVWVDVDHVQRGGLSLMLAIDHAMTQADLVLVFLSQATAKSRGSAVELNAAIVRNLESGSPRIIPVIIGDTQDVSPLLRQYQWIDLRAEAFESGVQRLIATIKIAQ